MKVSTFFCTCYRSAARLAYALSQCCPAQVTPEPGVEHGECGFLDTRTPGTDPCSRSSSIPIRLFLKRRRPFSRSALLRPDRRHVPPRTTPWSPKRVMHACDIRADAIHGRRRARLAVGVNQWIAHYLVSARDRAALGFRDQGDAPTRIR